MNNPENPIMDNEFPTNSASDKVTMMKVDLEAISNNHKAMIYFCSRILGKPEKDISIVDLRTFELKRFHNYQEHINNMAWPVGFYLEKIKKLQRQSSQRGARMQVLRDLLYGDDFIGPGRDKEIESWFDKDGVPL